MRDLPYSVWIGNSQPQYFDGSVARGYRHNINDELNGYIFRLSTGNHVHPNVRQLEQYYRRHLIDCG